MIRSALIALGLSAGAAQGQGLVQTAPLLETCGGTRLVLSAVGDVDTDDLTRAADVVNARIGGLYTQAFDYTTLNNDQIVVSMPAPMRPDTEALAPLFSRSDFAFFEAVGTVANLEQAVVAEGQIALPDAAYEQGGYILTEPAILDISVVESASATFDQNNRPAIAFTFDKAGTRIFADYTADNIGRPFAIVVNEKVMSAPTIQSVIAGGSGIITGNFNIEETEQLAAVLQGGVLPFDLEINAHEVMDGSDPSADFCP